MRALGRWCGCPQPNLKVVNLTRSHPCCRGLKPPRYSINTDLNGNWLLCCFKLKCVILCVHSSHFKTDFECWFGGEIELSNCYTDPPSGCIVTFTFMHLADAFIQSNLQLHSGYTFSLVHVFPGNRTHNLLRCWRNALPLSHTGTLLHCFIK